MSEKLTRRQVEELRDTRAEMDLITEHVSVAFAEFDTLDMAVDLIRAKMAHYSDNPVIWAVDAGEPDDGKTICITGNGPKSEAHAQWIALLMTYGDGLIERCLWLETVVNDLDHRLTLARLGMSA